MKRTIVLLFALAALASGAVSCGPGRTPTPTPTPLPVQFPGWEGITVHTLCLEVEQSYPEIEGGLSQPIAETATRILARLGLQAVTGEVPCEATLTFTLTSQALAADYAAPGAGTNPIHRCYTGAEVTGGVTLAVTGQAPLTVPVDGSHPASGATSQCSEQPADAPFDRAWSDALVDGLAQLWGIEVLVQALGDGKWLLREAAAQVLGHMGSEAVEAVPALIEALGDGEGAVRMAAAEALEKIGSDSVPALIQALRDDDWHVRYEAAGVLRKFGLEEGVVPALIEALRDKNERVRRVAAEALGEIGPEEGVVPALAQALGDGAWDVRYAAAQALRDIGPEATEAVPALIQALGDRTKVVRSEAAEALESITGRHFGQDADRWQQWWEEQE